VLYRHTGQHYDDVLGHGLAEYDLESHIGVDMRIRGDLSTKTLANHPEEEFPDTTVLPIVHGDTHAAGVFPQAWAFATDQFVAHNEAGLRGMMPPFENAADPAAFAADQFEGDWTLNRAEPFPEQYDTFVGSAASIYHGENVGERIVEFLDARRNDKVFEWASARAGFDTADRGFDYL